jgi:hypothetical protein
MTEQRISRVDWTDIWNETMDIITSNFSDRVYIDLHHAAHIAYDNPDTYPAITHANNGVKVMNLRGCRCRLTLLAKKNRWKEYSPGIVFNPILEALQ